MKMVFFFTFPPDKQVGDIDFSGSYQKKNLLQRTAQARPEGNIDAVAPVQGSAGRSEFWTGFFFYTAPFRLTLALSGPTQIRGIMDWLERRQPTAIDRENSLSPG